MGSRNYYKQGDYKATCPVCGFVYFASELIRRWDGVWVCKEDWEPRHPQEFIKAVRENSRLPFTAPEPTDVFVVVGDIDSLALNTRPLNNHHLG